MNISIVSLTPNGLHLAGKLSAGLAGAGYAIELLHKPKPFAQQIQQRFQNGTSFIFICATGIVVRTLAPVIENKRKDPPVLVLDDAGRFVIPLLSGHEGGANAFGKQVAEILGAQLVITSAHDYTQPVYTVGMGCERDCSSAELIELLNSCLHQANITADQISNISSIDIKGNEQGLIQLANIFGWPFETWDKTALQKVEHQLTQKSDIVFKEVGVYGVAEAAALVSASQLTGQAAELVLPKQKSARATCAIARSYFAKT